MHDHDIPRWETVHSEPVADAHIFKLRRDERRIAGTDRTGTFFVLDSPNWVNIVPITTDGKILLVEQFRQGTEALSLETPGGLIDESDDDMLAAAARELREETGYTAQSWRVLGVSDSNPAFMTNHFTAVLAEGATQTDPTAFDEHEDLVPRMVDIAEAADLLRRGAIRNTYSVLALCWFLLDRNGWTP